VAREWHGNRLLQAIGREAQALGNDLQQYEVVMFVMHQPRLQQLAASVTSQDESRFRGIEYGEGVCLRADSVQAMLDGTGTEEGPFIRLR
jgi:hypothetical protein